MSRRHGSCGDEAWSLQLLLGEIAARAELPDAARAVDCLMAALTLSEELGMAPLTMRCHLSLGTLRAALARPTRRGARSPERSTMIREINMRYWLPPAEHRRDEPLPHVHAPDGTLAKCKDSGAFNFAGGTAWTEIGTWRRRCKRGGARAAPPLPTNPAAARSARR